MTKIIEKNHHWHLDITIKAFFIGALILIAFVTLIRVTEEEVTKNQDMYKSCLDTCATKTTHWRQDIPEVLNINDPYRNGCIDSCNNFYYRLSYGGSD